VGDVDLDALGALLGADAGWRRRTSTGGTGISLPPLIDHHVHLHLIEERLLARGGIAGVVDLGGDPAALARRPRQGMPHTAYAGAFLTAPGGYPFGRGWAPDAIVRAVTSPSADPGVPGGARTLVDEQADAGAVVVKIVIHADGPALGDDAIAAVVAAARGRGLPVVAHAEGAGTTRRAVEHGVDVLAHAPFSEVADDAVLARAVAQGQRWISTLTIPGVDAAVAAGNLARFAAGGGRVLYGTDMGNGDRRAGVDGHELAALRGAGVRGPALVAALTDPWPLADRPAGVATFVAGPPPADEDGLPEWLSAAVVVPAEELVPA
jgi:hypothetical protein